MPDEPQLRGIRPYANDNTSRAAAHEAACQYLDETIKNINAYIEQAKRKQNIFHRCPLCTLTSFFRRIWNRFRLASH